MSRVFLASRNAKKIAEMQRILAEHLPDIEVLGLDDVEPYDEPAETEPTFEGNARLKAAAGVRATGLPSLADDSGLCVDALNGMPGVLSARWAGTVTGDGAAKDRANNELLLAQLADVPDERRTARFHCSVVFLAPTPDGSVEHAVAGEMAGRVIRADAGERRLRLRRALLRRRSRRHDGRAVGRGEGRDLPPGKGAPRDRAARRGGARPDSLTAAGHGRERRTRRLERSCGR